MRLAVHGKPALLARIVSVVRRRGTAIRHSLRVGIAVALMTPVLATGATAHADVPIPFDVNCQISYGVTLSPSGSFASPKTTIQSYGGNTSCSNPVGSQTTDAWLTDTTGATVQYGPTNPCTSCANDGSHGGPYGPVSDGSTWTAHYFTDIYLNNNIWTSYDRVHCQGYGSNGEFWHGISCTYNLPFVAGAESSVTATVQDIAVSVD